ncbi:MAG: hypothetical protein H2172_01145 [Opitutus sp.]|nr:hypothetical protein [Opitutus sp.]MCS6247950.1 hypothetical protein [Opitutus sp.]MCS6274430.1 hypothetical protein [Opitutus sp.]MCS6277186.1 hypothetical protein [Opitutus sp.]MCS6300308.1 hypothetical protein [Opitutus sp.]
MSQAPQFVISEFTNPSGEIVFRLTGWLDGKRIRKNFPLPRRGRPPHPHQTEKPRPRLIRIPSHHVDFQRRPFRDPARPYRWAFFHP